MSLLASGSKTPMSVACGPSFTKHALFNPLRMRKLHSGFLLSFFPLSRPPSCRLCSDRNMSHPTHHFCSPQIEPWHRPMFCETLVNFTCTVIFISPTVEVFEQPNGFPRHPAALSASSPFSLKPAAHSALVPAAIRSTPKSAMPDEFLLAAY